MATPSEAGKTNPAITTVLLGKKTVFINGYFCFLNRSIHQPYVQVTWEENIKSCCSLGMKPLLGSAPYDDYLEIKKPLVGEVFGTTRYNYETMSKQI
jgi:hypothetical protein